MERALPRRGQKCYTEPKPSRRQRAPGDQEELMLTFNHFNFNVADLDKSLAFYKEALGLEPVGERKAAADGSFIIVYLGDGKTDFRLELTWLRDHPQKYDLGECEFHLALRAEDTGSSSSPPAPGAQREAPARRKIFLNGSCARLGAMVH